MIQSTKYPIPHTDKFKSSSIEQLTAPQLPWDPCYSKRKSNSINLSKKSCT